jgi:hypothetical protein
MQLTLRDLLWLALLIAGLTTWGLQHRRSAQEAAALGRLAPMFGRRTAPSASAIARQTALKQLATQSNEELDRQFGILAASGQGRHAPDYEPYLTEMVRRRMVDSLQKHYDALMATEPESGFPYNLELLTALRRAQGQPDPLRIEVSLGDPAALGVEAPAPVVKAVVTNVDAGREAVHFTRGGDYRGGRRERWRVVLTDEQGRVVRDSNFASFIGGGIASVGPFAFGETDADGHAFDLRRYVAPDRSGRYQLQFVFHNELDLASEPDLAGLIVTKSQPIDVLIQVPVQNKLRPGVQALIAILAAAFALTLITTLSNRWQTGKMAIARRDIIWNCVLLAVALGAWQGDRYWQAKIASLQDDSKAKWSLVLAAAEDRNGD